MLKLLQCNGELGRAFILDIFEEPNIYPLNRHRVVELRSIIYRNW